MNKSITFSIILLLFISCTNSSEKKLREPYSFFVAGHTYGKPLANNQGLHPPFKKAFPTINSHPNIQFGVLAGDLVRYSTPESWDSVMQDLKELDMPVFAAPGNHDISELNLFEQYFGDTLNNMRTYRQFIFNDDLFIILDGNLDHWNIAGEQLRFLTETLDKYSKQVRNIFVFVHQLIWWDKDNEFKNVHLNWPPITPDSTNYWTELEPKLILPGKPVFMFAGDLGANNKATAYCYHKKNNIVYVAVGMGNMTDDNFIFVNIDKNGSATLELIALQGEAHRLGELIDYKLP